ncbi:MAG: MFS transporter, partial [Campylobacterales bacterium]|nr:MFS transporter [Campylobacterales bacterium]
MKKVLLRFLNIQEGEGSKIFHFFLFALFIQAGVAVGESVANSMFLINIGVEQLSIIYMITPFIILFFYIPTYSFFTARYGEKKFFLYSMAIMIITNIAIYFFIENASAFVPQEYYNYIFYFLLLYTTAMVITLYTLVWNFIDSFFDIMDSKRVFSIFSAGTAIGAIVGGVTVSLVTKYFSANVLLICWSLASIVAFFLLLKIPKKFKSIHVYEEQEELPLWQQLVTMVKNIKSSVYVLILLLVFFVSVVLATILEYEYMEILSKDQSVDSLAILFGKLYIMVNIFNLIVNFFLFNRLVIRFGVRNVLMIQPVAYLLVFAYLSVEVGIEAGVLGFFVVQGILASIDYNNQNLLYNGIHPKIKYEVRTFIENLGEPFATAAAGLFLFLITPTSSISQVAFIASGIALLYFILALILKYRYPIAMIKNLKDNWLDLTRDENVIIEKMPIKERERSLNYLENQNNSIMVAHLIRTYDEPKATEILLNRLNHANSTVYIHGKILLEKILNSNDVKVMSVALNWINSHLSDLNILLKKELGSRGLISINKLVPYLD